jgi:hypothetical protein
MALAIGKAGVKSKWDVVFWQVFWQYHVVKKAYLHFCGMICCVPPTPLINLFREFEMQKIKRNIAGSVMRRVIFIIALAISITVPLHFSLAEEATAANSNTSIPELPFAFSVKWDISKEDNQLVQDFVVNERDPFSWFHIFHAPSRLFQAKAHPYHAYIRFQSVNKEPLSAEEWKQLMTFVGNGALDARTYKPVPSGVTIPVDIKIEKIDANHIDSIVPEQIIDTTNQAAHSAARLSMDRFIDDVGTLPAGKYRISIRTAHAVNLPPKIETFLMIKTRID